jgi:hypothetical protein
MAVQYSFPDRQRPAANAPTMYLRFEPGGAVRKLDLPETAPLTPLPCLRQMRADRIAREVTAKVAQMQSLPRFDPRREPESLSAEFAAATPPATFGAGLFVVPTPKKDLLHRQPTPRFARLIAALRQNTFGSQLAAILSL